MVHVVTPSDQPRVAILTDLAVVMVGRPLKKNHQRNHPEPAEVFRGQKAENQNHERPNEGQHRQMISLQPFWNSGDNYRRQATLQRRDERRISLLRAGKLSCFYHKSLVPSVDLLAVEQS